MTDILAVLRRGLAGSHEIERELGRGGMARVFLARELKHDRLVALKVLDPDLARAVGSERFLREIRLAARLQHPHILTVHDSGEVPGDGHAPSLLWFSMPYVEGETLRERMNREGQLPLKAAVAIARETADALAYAHAHGVIHRDIKPENLLLTGGHVLVADFGVARAMGDEGQRLTSTGLAIGTPAYMSPEQATADRVDHRTDIYSLGAVLYEMVAGEPPYPAPTPALALTRAITEPLRPLSSLRATVPVALDQVAATALASGPADRFESAAEMAGELEAALGASGATPSSTHAVTPRQRRVSRKLLAGLGVLLIAVISAVALAARRGSAPDGALDRNLIAIAPFDLVSSDAELEVWSEGIVDVVARYFDGAGTIRAVAPTRAIRSWSGRADRESAGTFGSKVRAGYVVFGQIVGADTVRLSATLYDVTRGRPLDEGEWHGSARRLDLLVDSLSTRFLDVMGRTHQLGQPRVQPFGTSDPLAMRAFLTGMYELRKANYEDAADLFLESVRQDTGFVLGRSYAGHSLAWADAGNPEISTLWLEAGARNRGLARRDSLLVLSDSIDAAGRRAGGLTSQSVARLGHILDTLLALNPDDPEVLLRATDASLHLAPSQTPHWYLKGFRHAIELDSLNVPAYQHAIQFSVMLEQPAATRALIRQALRLAGSDTERAETMRLVDLLLDAAATEEMRQEALNAASSAELRRAYDDLWLSPDSTCLMIVRTGERRFPDDPGWKRSVEYQLIRRGHLRQAAARLVNARSRGSEVEVPDVFNARELVMVGALPLAFFDSLVDDFERLTGRLRPEGIPLWVAAGDTSRIDRLAAQETDRDTYVSAAQLEDRAAFHAFYDAARLLAKGDTAGFRVLARHPVGSEPLVVGLHTSFSPFGTLPLDIRLALGADDAAWKLLQSRGGSGSITNALWHLYRARLAEQRGERDVALDDYTFIARLWADADEPLRSHAREAREALARLTAER